MAEKIIYSNNRFELVWTNINASKKLIENLTQNICKGAKETYYQSSWMGRGCYKRYKNGYLFLKGIGPTKGSESFRKIMGNFWMNHSPIDKGGCVRLSNNDFPVLIEYYYINNSQIKLFDPRPEGYSIFGAVLREAIISQELFDLGFFIPSPVAVYKTMLRPPWSSGNKSAMGEYCRKQFITDQRLDSSIQVEISKVQYEDVKAGLLVRHFESNVRFQEVVETFLHNPQKLKKICSSLNSEAQSMGLNNWVDRFEHGMFSNLKMLMKYSVIHSNLQTHYQNCTMSGEICDWDAAVFCLKTVHSQKFEKILKEESRKNDANMMRYYKADCEMQINYTKSAVLQIYAIINCCAFARFISDYSKLKSFCNRKSKMYFIKSINHFLSLLNDLEKASLIDLLRNIDETSLDMKIIGKTSIFGWNCIDRDLDYSKYICKAEDVKIIKNDIFEFKTSYRGTSMMIKRRLL